MQGAEVRTGVRVEAPPHRHAWTVPKRSEGHHQGGSGGRVPCGASTGLSTGVGEVGGLEEKNITAKGKEQIPVGVNFT